MNFSSRWTRLTAALAVAAAVAPVAIATALPATASAAPLRTATTHTDSAHARDVLGLLAKHANPLIESVSYDRFRRLLQRSGDSAFLIGDPAEDASFAARAREVEAAAEAAGLTKVYWFDPNSADGARLVESSWRKLVGQDLKSLSDAVPETAGNVESAKIFGANSYFFLSYRPTGFAPTATKIISWIDLSKEASGAATRADVTTAIQNDRNLAPKDALVIAHDDDSQCSPEITNPAQHPYYVEVQIDGETYQDGCDTLPGYDDWSCSPIPDVQYDFADNEIFYYNDQGDLLAVAPWTEWQRISSYKTWLAQQQAAASSNGSDSTGSGATGSGSSGSGSGGSGSSGSGSTSSGSTNSDSLLSRVKVKRVSGAVSKAPTGKATGKYRVTITTPRGKSTATGKVTIRIYKVGSHTATIAGELSHGTVTITVPKLARGTWKVLISWPGNTHYLADSAAGGSIKVTK